MFSGSAAALLAGCAFTLLLACACVSDARTRRIPNALVATLAVGGLLFSLAASPLLPGLARGLGGLGLGLALWLPFYALRLLGAGDVKLFAAAGAWLGPMAVLEGALVAAVVGGLLSTVWLLRDLGLRRTVDVVALWGMLPWDPRSLHTEVLAGSRLRLPYGIALSIGAATVAWHPGLLL